MWHYCLLMSNKRKMNLTLPLSNIRIIEQGRLLEWRQLLQCGHLVSLMVPRLQPRDKAAMLNYNKIEFFLRNLHEIS